MRDNAVRLSVAEQDIRQVIRTSNLSTCALCLHASLKSFGHVVGGASAVINAFLHESCILLAPTFSWTFAIPVPPSQRIARNGWNYATFAGPTTGIGKHYTPSSQVIDKDMGAVAAAVLAHPQHKRGNHPLCSFTALGLLSTQLVSGQTPNDVYAPLRELVQQDGFVILMGVDFTKLTLLHLAEQLTGRKPFRRWANDTSGQATAAQVGSCSDGFNNFAPYLQPLSYTTQVGPSTWTILSARKTLEIAVSAIRANPEITHCGNKSCDRCNDAVAGGPTI